MTNSQKRLIVYYGNGKGKTTASLGLALRMLGGGGRVFARSFIKGEMEVGELNAAKIFGERFDYLHTGSGFIRDLRPEEMEEAKQQQRKIFFDVCAEAVKSNADLVIIDEALWLEELGFISADEILKQAKSILRQSHLVLTGRTLNSTIKDRADIVTEMVCRKHCYDNGVPAIKGIEF